MTLIDRASQAYVASQEFAVTISRAVDKVGVLTAAVKDRRMFQEGVRALQGLRARAPLKKEFPKGDHLSSWLKGNSFAIF